MQLSEVSELRGLISLLRLNACNSPRFHDRQDSEVDRIFNSSPKVASFEMRSSWMERQSIQAALPTPTSTNGAAPQSSPPPHPPKLKPTVSEKRPANGGNNPPGKPRVVVFDKKKSKRGDSDDDSDEESFMFEREPVESLPSAATTALDAALKGSSGMPMGLAGTKAAIDSPVLYLKIYLPNRQEMNLELYEISTVEESIQAILSSHRKEARQPPLYYGHPECYDLRLHDMDGYPDEDCPALDRSRKIKNFGDNGDHEFCLCERPDACPPNEHSPDTYRQGSTSGLQISSQDNSLSIHRRFGGASDKAILKIFMPNDNYTVVALKDGMCGKDLLPVLARRHRLPVLDEYVLKVNDAEKVRLDLVSDEIDLDRPLKPLGLQEVTLARKVYADAPKVSAHVAPTSDATEVDENPAEALKNVRPDPSTFMYNDVKAAMYKEWKVMKTNKFRKRQHRMFGVDLHKVYNKKVGERAMISRTNIKVSERPISSITWLRFLTDPCDFQIHFSQPEEETIDYSAESAYECAEIVAKLMYIRDINKRK
ncbi:hypothetical protein SDRG_03870 [Saprolegnia diclina VS20]|uniref:RBD domain-containing protein n=1 Tax=Saprolegnia diclina (strain VS20) TaxID=1156394 RepID=T0S7Z0_SAPDV|nr:hypothetical protein SDRG_03870 [Saprolegnia diclina VS20]EQC38912.1 hypothetical protein SDRG_03870 [Saprolegnia diclina VS20]|eukprot:XP_008607736.1 hypothetical protein SDRG_03870 [Saprolegnia diclina VS20]